MSLEKETELRSERQNGQERIPLKKESFQSVLLVHRRRVEEIGSASKLSFVQLPGFMEQSQI